MAGCYSDILLRKESIGPLRAMICEEKKWTVTNWVCFIMMIHGFL